MWTFYFKFFTHLAILHFLSINNIDEYFYKPDILEIGLNLGINESQNNRKMNKEGRRQKHCREELSLDFFSHSSFSILNSSFE